MQWIPLSPGVCWFFSGFCLRLGYGGVWQKSRFFSGYGHADWTVVGRELSVVVNMYAPKKFKLLYRITVSRFKNILFFCINLFIVSFN